MCLACSGKCKEAGMAGVERVRGDREDNEDKEVKAGGIGPCFSMKVVRKTLVFSLSEGPWRVLSRGVMG